MENVNTIKAFFYKNIIEAILEKGRKIGFELKEILGQGKNLKLQVSSYFHLYEWNVILA